MKGGDRRGLPAKAIDGAGIHLTDQDPLTIKQDAKKKGYKAHLSMLDCVCTYRVYQ